MSDIEIVETGEYEKKGKKTKFILLLITIILINILLLILPIVLIDYNVISISSYSIDNYRYTLSAVLQSLAAVFAFIASSTILLLQLSGDNSPRSLKFFPKKTFILLLISLLTIIAFDIICLVFLTHTITKSFLIVILDLIAINLIGFESVIIYVVFIVNWLKPETMLKMLTKKADKSITNQERSEIVKSLEELTIKCIHKGYSSTVLSAIDTYKELIAIFIGKTFELNTEEKIMCQTEHPLRIIPDSIERIAVCLCRSHMSGLVHHTAWVLRELLDNNIIRDTNMCAVEVQSSACIIIKECLDNKLKSPAYNFSANLSYFDENIHPTNGIIWSIKEMAIEAADFPDGYIVISEVLNGLLRINNYTQMIIGECIGLIVELTKYESVMDKKGWFEDITIGEQIKSLNTILDMLQKGKRKKNSSKHK